jgi:CrcB protein
VTLALVLIGGAVGAPLRYLIDLAVQRSHSTGHPWGTFTVNMVGSFVLGCVLGGASTGALSPEIVAVLGTGLCGALTTFSTFGYETVRLIEDGALREALTNVVLSLALGLALGAFGWFVGAQLA